jgi:hypothetical protein
LAESPIHQPEQWIAEAQMPHAAALSTQDCADNHFQSTETSPRSWLMANRKVGDQAAPGNQPLQGM